jgi:serine/threonine protein kinase/tetratricopeptide (TPR) repeat protein
MALDFQRIQGVFQAVAELAPAERTAVLERQCAGDAELRRRIEALLKAHDDAGELPAAQPEPMVTCGPAVQPGQVFAGRYKLREKLGEGGMGVVFVADQTEPVERRVALKIIRAGLDTHRLLARFEQERQALALMDHPNIAKVFDAGMDQAGRPYFAMELVRGLPLTKYCDDARLSPRQRLELFIPVCQAVQHAHQKGIIHRDLKPSNILVGLYDDRPVPKVIDFGVAKATGPRLTEQSLYTEIGSIIGTLEYMSPEQAQLNNLDVDTRSDIYTLGVILYELLTGAVPFSCKELQQAGLAEMLRIIKETEPSRPSTKLSHSGTLPSIAAQRQTEPHKLTALLRGELDWIVMKALEKDRGRRYETANGFAMDVQRYLADEPIQACPPSAGYRLRKFVRRNKGPVVAASVVLFCLVAGIVGTSAGLVWAARERDEKAQALIAETKARLAEQKMRDQAVSALRAMTDDIENQMARATHLTEENKELLRKIVKHFEGFAALTADDAESRAIRAEGYARVGLMRYRLGELKEAETAYADALAIQKQLVADFPARPEFRHELASTHNKLGILLRNTGRPQEAETAFAEALAIQKGLAADFPARPEFRQALAGIRYNVGNLLNAAGRFQEAETAYADALALRKQLASDFPTRPILRRALAMSYNSLGWLYHNMGRLKEAERAYADALTIQKQLAADFPTQPLFRQELATSHHNLGNLLRDTDRLKDAETALADALLIQKQLAADFPARPDYREELAATRLSMDALLQRKGRLKEAETAKQKQ